MELVRRRVDERTATTTVSSLLWRMHARVQSVLGTWSGDYAETEGGGYRVVAIAGSTALLHFCRRYRCGAFWRPPTSVYLRTAWSQTCWLFNLSRIAGV